MPVDVIDVEHPRYYDTKLYIEDLPLQDFAGDLSDVYTRAIPVRLLASLKTAAPTPPLVTRLDSLRHLLVSSPHLETLRFVDRGQGTQFEFESHERLPALRELSLQSYDWRHSREEVSRHWDFSRITTLELVSVPMYNFLSSVDFSDFAGLRTLHCEDFSAHHSPDRREEATQMLHKLIESHIRGLTELNITVHTEGFSAFRALYPHAATLKTLRLRDHTGFDDEERRCPTLGHEDLVIMSHHLQRLEVLELDMDVLRTNPLLFLRAIGCFPALHTLTLNIQTAIMPYNPVPLDRDCDRDGVLRMFEFLVSFKHGEVPWKTITFVVGGWKKVMVRRMSEAWKQLNAKGIFAERCFVMDIGPDSTINVREEAAVEASQHVTPETQNQRAA